MVVWWSVKSEPQVEALKPMLYDDEGSVLFQNVLILLPLKIILCDATFLGTDFWCILERLCIFQNSSDGLWLENKCPPIAVSFDVLKYRYAKPAVFLLCLMELVDICFQYVLFRHPSHQVLVYISYLPCKILYHSSHRKFISR